jgi:hypothetical protein
MRSYFKGQLVWRDPCTFSAEWPAEFTFSDELMSGGLIHHVTDQFYDSEVASKRGGLTPKKPWLLFFIVDRFNQYYQQDSHAQNLAMFMDLLWQVKRNVYGDYNLGFVDITDHGENLKETFDVEKAYAMLMVKNGQVFEMPNNDFKWTVQDVVEFLEKPEGIGMPVRTRVDGVWMYYEYFTNYMVQHYFKDLISFTYKARANIKDWSGYEIDFKSTCPLFGKKHKAKKAQVRTVMRFLLPSLAIGVIVSLAALVWLLLAIVRCLTRKQKMKVDEEPKVQDIKTKSD